MADTAIAAATGRLASLAAAAINAVVAALGTERDRWVLWVPVALGLGIGLYFELAVEPGLWSASALAFAALLLTFAVRRHGGALAASVALLAGSGGLLAAKLHADWAKAPVLAERLGPVTVRGRIVEAEPTHKGLRVVLRLASAGRLTPERLPHYARLTLRGTDGGLTAGDEIEVRAILLPPPPPAAPGAYDFQRYAYFQQIGAVGYALAEPDVTKRATDSRFSAAEWLERLRQHITERIIAVLPSPTGALAAAQITGHRNTIPPEVMTAMQDSGLAHLLAISGMNIGIVAGIVFFAVRALLALVPWLALRISTKKWAAVAALIVALAYVLISGASVPTQRAYLMLGVVMVGVLLDREALSMRLVAWAAVAILLAAPDGLLGPSFQMSFAAVVALIACYERWAQRRPALEPAGWARRWLRGIALLALTSLVAGLATAPFGMYSFNRVTAYGLVANMIAVPATDLWVMPWALISMLAMPFGLDAWPLAAMGWGVDLVHGVARQVAAWPGAVVPTAVLPGWGLLVFALGGLWLAIWQRRWRWAGVPVMTASLLSMLLVRPPDLLIAGEGKTMALRAGDGGYYLSTPNARGFIADTWFKRDGSAGFRAWPRRGATADGRLRCDPLGCIYSLGKHRIAVLRESEALVEDCAATLVVAPALTRTGCRGLVIDRRRLMSRGAHAVWFGAEKLRVLDDRSERGERPWVSYPWKDPPHRKRSLAQRN
ncbi:MAG: ComEC/Rec2 family competence protein [Rhodospirillaceae bacterium]|nr:ComEC/Rec2 family competence protein [Rhodospirillaceae bacterium]